MRLNNFSLFVFLVCGTLVYGWKTKQFDGTLNYGFQNQLASKLQAANNDDEPVEQWFEQVCCVRHIEIFTNCESVGTSTFFSAALQLLLHFIQEH